MTMVLGLAAAVTALAAQPARAVPVAIDISISFAPNGFPATGLSGQIQFVLAPQGPPIDIAPQPPPIDIGNVLAGGTFLASFQPSDPCLGDGSCSLGFSFAGNTSFLQTDLTFPVSILLNPNDLPNALPSPPPIDIGALDVLSPDPPPIRLNGFLVGFDGPEIVGTFSVTLRAADVPEPATLALLGLGLLGLGVARRRRRAA
jgi:hypothetical protein